MYFSLREITVVRILLPFIIGVVIGDNFIDLPYVVELFSICSVLYICTAYLNPKVRLIVQNQLIFLLFLLAGLFTMDTRDQLPEISPSQLGKPTYSTIVLRDFPKTRNSHIIRGDILAIDHTVLHTPVLIEAYAADSSYIGLSPLDTIIVETVIRSTPQPADPYSFNYGRYLRHQYIQYQAWAGAVISYRPIQKYRGLSMIRYGLRERIITIIKDRFEDEIASVLSALLVGYRYDLDPDLQKQFANSGAIHVLAVSGLHVGMVVMLLKLLFRRLPRSRYITFVEFIVLIGGLSLYSLLTGLSVPVMRASLIFTILLSSRNLPFHVNSLNALAAVAFIIAIIDPHQIFQLGFQMSFAAVTGILLYYQLIYKMIYVKNKVLNYIWSLSAVSLAAQVFIVPLSLYYFHQFPTYFLFSSLIAIACATVVIAVGIPLLLLGFFNEAFLNGLVMLKIPASIMIKTAAFFDQLYGSVLKVIWYDQIHVTLLFIASIAITIYVRSRRIHWLHLSLCSVISFGLMCTYNLLQQKQQVAVSTYEEDEELTDIIIGTTVYELDAKSHSKNKKLFLTKNFRHAKGVKEVESAENLYQLLNDCDHE